tara:strand:+ start:296 stop:505 length:210 start_codon:yes stop_codon:yes gene_type:complete
MVMIIYGDCRDKLKELEAKSVMETISNLALIQAVKASQIRRNKAVEAERIRKSARDKFVRYFSKFSLKG